MNTYAFDDCSILNTCEVKIPKAYQIYVGKSTLNSQNFSKLNSLIKKLNYLKILKFRFVPSTIKDNIVKAANQIIEDERINIHRFSNLARPFKAEVIGYLEQFGSEIETSFEEIKKKENISSIRTFFIDNERELTKERNIPEDDDLMIISGYKDHDSEWKKHLITHDEHFWRYKDLILSEFGIMVIEEWNCDKLIT